MTLCAAASLVLAGPALATIYGLPPSEKITATQADVDELDRETEAVVHSLRNGSPVAVDFAERAHGILIFPKVEHSAFILGGASAIGALYTRDESGGYGKFGYYRAQRASIGLQSGSETSSRVFMFMKPEKLTDFIEGRIVKWGIDGTTVNIDPATGTMDGDPEADIAVFILNRGGSIDGLQVRNLKIDRVEIVQ